MTRNLSYLFIIFLLLGCTKKYEETYTIKIEGKPVSLVYRFHLKHGSVKWSYKGEIIGKVGVCISGCSSIVEDQFTATCPQTEVLTGKFNILHPVTGYDEELVEGREKCFVFVPEKGTKGSVQITFKENSRNGNIDNQ